MLQSIFCGIVVNFVHGLIQQSSNQFKVDFDGAMGSHHSILNASEVGVASLASGGQVF